MDYKELYEELLTEYKLLEGENIKLREQLRLAERSYFVASKDDGSVNMYSPSSKKIALFCSLFKGREDVFARRWFNAKTGKSGYSPVCVNEWNPSLCNKRLYKCSNCKNRSYLSLEFKHIEAHLKGASEICSDVVGIYPLCEGDFCYFLVIDFDGKNWQDDVSSVREVCAEMGIPVCVERSRSGDGGHVWFFFQEKTSATLARKFGSMLLTLAMERRHELDFTSYDRLFPNQDYVPNGGMGNLIALPLQGRARRDGNSVFVDESFKPYPDQWSYLNGIQKLSVDKINSVLAESGSETGALSAIDDDAEKPWKGKSGKMPTAFDFPSKVNAVLSDMLYIEKTGISEFALNKIKRLAAFPNPEFYKAQKMRLQVYNKPRIISTCEEYGEYLALPRGCADEVKELLSNLNVNFNIAEKRNCGKLICVEFKGQLRDEQIPAFNALNSNYNGVLCATTAFGKTVIAAKLIADKKVNALILVHSAALLNQWRQALSKFLVLNNVLPEQPKKRGRKKNISQIGQLGATKNTLNGFVDIAIMQSLINGGEVKSLVKNYGLVIVDECHHVPAVSFENVLKSVTAKYVYGLTATPQRQDGHQKIIYMQCGAIRYRVDAKQQAENSGFAHIVIPRFTLFRSPLCVGKSTLQAVFEKLCESGTRNALILNDVLNAVKAGRNVLVLTERRTHAELLEHEISKSGIKTFLLIGAESAKLKREKLAEIYAKENTEKFVIVATGKYIGEGFDSARLDTLFLTMPISWKGKLAQYVGRLHRIFDGKREVIVYDYVDVNVGMLENMYRKRVLGYRALGYELKAEDNGKRTGILFDKFNYLSVFKEDLLSANKSVLIVCPKLTKSFIERFVYNISLLDKPVLVTIVANTGEDDEFDSCVEKLKLAGVAVKESEDLHNNFAIIDDVLIWYGSIAYLTYSSADATALRFESKDTVNELKGVLN